MLERLFLILIFMPLALNAQTKKPTVPTASNFNPETNKFYFNSMPNGLIGTGNIGGTKAQDIINQQNARAMQQMGYKPPVLPSSDPLVNHQRMLEHHNRTQQRLAIVNEALEDMNNIRDTELAYTPAYYNSEKFRQSHARYQQAKEVLSSMLSGKSTLSLKDAFYALESAYGDNYLSYLEYEATLKKSADFIKQWLQENGKPLNNIGLHYGIQSFMRDTLTVAKLVREPNGVTKTRHLPFVYDYQDFRAEEDFRNYFVTKTLATGAGQCNSLPAAYLLLAEQLGAKAYLSFAPLHSFIKFPDEAGVIHNYEPTSHFEISDQWYAQHLYIGADAYRNRLYLDTLNKKQIVASAMMDLAFGYLRKKRCGRWPLH